MLSLKSFYSIEKSDNCAVISLRVSLVSITTTTVSSSLNQDAIKALPQFEFKQKYFRSFT